MVPFVKFSPTLTIDDVTHTMTLVCTRGLNEILGFELNEIGERRLRGRKAGAGAAEEVEATEEAKLYLASKAITWE